MAKTQIGSKEVVAENHPFYKHSILKRIDRNKNVIMVIVGETGSGKSYTALSIAEKLDPNFDTSRLVFKADGVVKLIKSDLPAGSVIIFDEAGVDFQARNFMSKGNKNLSYVLQTCRFKNNIIIITIPDLSFLDAQGRKLIHYILTTDHIKYAEKVAVVKPFKISVMPNDGRVFKTYPVYTENGEVTKIKELHVTMASKEIIQKYEEKKNRFAKELYNRVLAESDNTKSKGLNSLTEIPRRVYELDVAGIPTKRIAEIIGKTLDRTYNIRKENVRKGFNAKDHIAK